MPRTASTIVEGSFFDAMPAGADLYVLSRVLHNWPDDEAATVLHRIRDAIAGDGRLIVLEELIDSGGAMSGAAGGDDGRAAGQDRQRQCHGSAHPGHAVGLRPQ